MTELLALEFRELIVGAALCAVEELLSGILGLYPLL